MFVYTVRASGLKLFAVVLLTLGVLSALVLGGGTVLASATPSEIDFSGMKTEEDRKSFLNAFGIEVADGEECESFVMPENFDRILLGYNELQRSQGLDISKYVKKKITRYTYTVLNYEGYDGEVKANLLVYRNRIIACDISSADPEGFVEPIVGRKY